MTSNSKMVIVQGRDVPGICPGWKKALPCQYFLLKLSRDPLSGVMHSQVIPSFGDRAQVRMAEGCLSVVKSQSSWEGEAGQKESVQCQPFPGRSLSGEGPWVVQNLETDLLDPTSLHWVLSRRLWFKRTWILSYRVGCARCTERKY